MAELGKIAIIGAGLIGRSWAMLFASAGYSVSIFDADFDVAKKALETIAEELVEVEDTGLRRGALSAEEQLELISVSETIEECVEGAFYVQESAPEDKILKKAIFHRLDRLADDSMILCSSTSCIPPSVLSEHIKRRSQVLVAHPFNPPYHIRAVEIIPSPQTDPEVLKKTLELMEAIGQKPVICKKEVYGFAINRMQYAIINECWRLVQDGVMSVEDVDTVMSEGLGMRYAFLGVFETCHLNANGMIDYCDRYAKGIHDTSETFGPPPKMEGETAAEIHRQLCEKIPLQDLDKWRKWRNDRLACLIKLKRALES